MATGQITLPPGFELDEQSGPNLPEGFELDAPEQPGKLEAFGRGMLQGGTAGFADEAAGAENVLGSGKGIVRDAVDVAGQGLTIPTISNVVRKYLLDKHNPAQDYREGRDTERAANTAAEQSHPVIYGAGEFAPAAISAPLAPELMGIRALAAQGVMQSLGNSDADLTKGDVVGATEDAAIGGAVGLTLGAAGKVLNRMVNPEALEDIAQTRGAKALGYTKRLMNTPEKDAAAKTAAQKMLDNGVITPLASPEEMAGRVSDVIESSGKRIGEFLRERGNGFETQSAVDEINNLRPKNANGEWLRGGQYEKVHQMLDNAIDTVRAHGDVIPFEEANKLKGFLQDMVSWNSTKLEGNVGRGIAGSMRNAVDTSLEKTGADTAGFLNDKATYKAGLEAQDALANRLSSERGNKNFGLTDTILGAGELAAGNPVGAVAGVAGKKFIERYGNQTIASGSDWLAKTLKASPNVFGGYAHVLVNALERGAQSLAATHFLLQHNDPEYQSLIQNLSNGGNK